MDLQELTHSHAFEIVLQSIADCDRLVAALKKIFKSSNIKIISADHYQVVISH